MILAFLGDVVGKTGRHAVAWATPRIRALHAVDLVIANAENSAGGFGINPTGIAEMEAAGVAFFTTGNHVWDKREGIALLDSKPNIVRPANYPDGPGRGAAVVPNTDGRVAVLNLQGRVFMPPLDCPFRKADELLAALPTSAKVIVVDFHGEATSEKIAMGYYLDGRVSLVLGTHTHVPTKDARIFAGGTGYVTDVGMTGSYDSILGVLQGGRHRAFPQHAADALRSGQARRSLRLRRGRQSTRSTGRTRRFEHHQLTPEA